MNVPRGFVQVWDDWLQRALLQGVETHGGRWDEYYMSAPIWRFCLSQGLAGPDNVLGVMMPSVDRVGRRFPLTFMAPIQNCGSAILAHFREEDLFRQAEELALAALEDDMTRDRLAEQLAGLPVPGHHVGALVREAGQALVLTQKDGITEALPDLVAGLLDGRYKAPSILSTEIDGVPRLMICEGLPTGANMQGLFDMHAAVWTGARPI